jgi:hypothetical protein
MLEIAGGIIIAVFALTIIGTIAQSLYKKIAFGKAYKALEAIQNNPRTPPMPEEDEMANKVQLVQLKCKYAENFVKDIDSRNTEISDRAKEKLENYIQTALQTAQEVDDEFYNSAILHSISNLLSKSGQFDRANKLINLMAVDYMRDQAHEFMDSEKKSRIASI